MTRNNVKALYLILHKIIEYPQEHNEDSKDTLKKYEELWTKIKDLIRSINNKSDDYDNNTLDDDLLLKKN